MAQMTTTPIDVSSSDGGSDPEVAHHPTVRDRFVPPMPGPRWLAWLAPALVAVFAGALRFIRLGQPPHIYFDEVYYALDAFGLRTFGVEYQTVEDAEQRVNAGDLDIWLDTPDMVVHPPFGKWMIAAGDYLWGLLPFGEAMSPTGWRVAAAVVGALSVLLLARLALRMTRSILLGCMAGLILALDGLHFTQSRIAMLDIFLMFWLLAGVACLVADRDRVRARLADLADYGDTAAWWLGVRWWRIAAGVCFGLAAGTKWSALFYVAVFGLLTVAWDYGARRTAGQRRAIPRWFLVDAAPAFFQIVVVGFLTYLATWAGWLFTTTGYNRAWAAGEANGVWALVPEPLRATVAAFRGLWQYHGEMYRFHSELNESHAYASSAWEWIVMRTPVVYHFDGNQPGCGAPNCASTVVGLGTPVVWWLSIVALLVLLGWWATYRDWRAGVVLAGVAAGWLPWFAYPDRTMFVFYALPFLPFLVLAIVLAIGLLLGPDEGSPRFSQPRRVVGGIVSGVVMLLVLANFVYLYPVLSAENVRYEDWDNRMWFDTWVYGNQTPGESPEDEEAEESPDGETDGEDPLGGEVPDGDDAFGDDPLGDDPFGDGSLDDLDLDLDLDNDPFGDPSLDDFDLDFEDDPLGQ